MYTALYRTFRPEIFEEVLGQEHIVRILKNQIRTETTSHAYLFCGTRGTGKTTTARLLAKGVNCLAEEGDRPCGQCANCKSIKEGSFLDVIEIDAASNNGVENIRELRESVKYPPVTGRCKTYIIDEVHMLSTGAFNALLKTLEEPPENVMFILATTEPQKLPATILSRCLRLDFHRVSEQKLRAGMKDICDQLGVQIEDSALGLIASNADGSVRDGLSLLDQCLSGGEKQVSREAVLELLGTSGEEVFLEITELTADHQIPEALLLLNRILDDGKDVRQFMKDWISHFRSLMMTKLVKRPEDILNLSAENVERIREQSGQLSMEWINNSILELSKTLVEAKWSTQPRILLELCIVRLGSQLDVQTGSGQTTAVHQQAGQAPLGQSAAIRQQAEQTPVSRPTATRQQEEQTPVSRPTAIRQQEEQAPVSRPTATPQKEPTDSPIPPKSSGETAEKSPSNIPQADLEELWHQVLEKGEAVKSSFNLLRSGTRLVRLTEQKFYVEAQNPISLKFTEDNKKELEALVEELTGSKLMMECHLPGEPPDSEKGVDVEELAQSIQRRLGLTVEIE